MLTLTEYPIERKTDRDLELPVLYEFLDRTEGTIGSVIDVGAHYSTWYYAERLRTYVDLYDALDPNMDKDVAKIADDFFVEDAETHWFNTYDLVLCLSTIEHVGMYPIKAVDYKVKRRKIIEKMLKSAQKYLWLSFPVGLAHIIPGEMAIVTREELDDWLSLMQNYQVTIGFFHSDGPQAGFPWKTCEKEDVINSPYLDHLGTRGICILEVRK